jgi:hypothetical protein
MHNLVPCTIQPTESSGLRYMLGKARHVRCICTAMTAMNTLYDIMSSRAAITFRASGNNGGACCPGPATADTLSSATLQQVVVPMSDSRRARIADDDMPSAG